MDELNKDKQQTRFIFILDQILYFSNGFLIYKTDFLHSIK